MLQREERDSVDRKRARHAYEMITAYGRDLGPICARAQGLPIEVRTQGLTTVLATLVKNEKRSECSELASWLARWLIESSGLAQLERRGPLGLLEWATNCSRDEYQALQAEALAYLEHVKRLLSVLKEVRGA